MTFRLYDVRTVKPETICKYFDMFGINTRVLLKLTDASVICNLVATLASLSSQQSNVGWLVKILEIILMKSVMNGVTEKVQEQFCKAFTSFAKTGDPNHGKIPMWKSCDSDHLYTMILTKMPMRQ